MLNSVMAALLREMVHVIQSNINSIRLIMMMIIITVTIKLIIRKIILTCFYELVENDSVTVINSLERIILVFLQHN